MPAAPFFFLAHEPHFCSIWLDGVRLSPHTTLRGNPS
jgi:hypothetical protein